MKKIVFMIIITICATQIGCVKNQPSSIDQNSSSKSFVTSEIQQISDYSQVSNNISVNFSESSNVTNIKKIELEDLQIGNFKIGMSFTDF